jgi:RNase P subunit RPR2
VLVLDIECSPDISPHYGPKTRFIGHKRVLEFSRVICWAAKWLGPGNPIMSASDRMGHRNQIETAYRLVDQADILVTFNGQSFDVKHLEREWLLAGLPPQSPVKHVDLYREIRRRFAFYSNSMAHILHMLGLDGKHQVDTMQLGLDCALRDDPDAWQQLERYNRQDVRQTEAMYWRVLPWLDRHPAVRLSQSGELLCRNCGSPDLQQIGVDSKATLSYPMYRCRKCGALSRAAYRSSRQANTVGTR